VNVRSIATDPPETEARARPATEQMHWVIAAPFTRDAVTDRWLAPFVPPGRQHFTLVPARPRPSWHERSGPMAGFGDWTSAWQQGNSAWRTSRGGVITVFPQLALTVGLRKRLSLASKPVVAWCFNLGALHRGLRRGVARASLAHVDRFVVHSRAETIRYAEWLDLPRERFRFVPLQRALIPIEEREDERSPFVLAMGSARRDYATFLEAVRRSKLPTLVVAARHALAGLEIPDNVEVRNSLSANECRRLAQRARVNVVPVSNQDTASGQVTLVEAMRMGRAVVATRCMGSEDYIESEATGLLVEARSAEALQRAIERLWDDAALRERLAANAARFTAERCSDEAAGAALGGILDELAHVEGARADFGAGN
jgi:glycosyltransferase involved in cell wall biosynthesis